MSKRNKIRSRISSEIVQIGLSPSTSTTVQNEVDSLPKRNRLWFIAVIGVVLLLGVGVFAKNGWFPRTDALSGKRTSWFGKEIAKDAPNSWNLLAPPLPTPTPQLSKEYIYAGSRLLAIDDANANAAPPADLAVWRPSNGTWYVLGGAGSQQVSYSFGLSGDKTVQADFDGDGKTDFAIFRPSTNNWWIVKSSDNTAYNVAFGDSSYNDVLVPADYDGDGKTDVAVWRPSTYYFYISPSSTGVTSYYQFGTSGDTPIPADYDGDGKADVGVWRSSTNTFYSVNSSNGQTVSSVLGTSGDTPVSADYDGDGKADYALFRNSNATWYIKQSSNAQTQTIQYGATGDTLVPNDYDGDGKVDIAVWRVLTGLRNNPGYWYIRQSHDLSTRSVSWGTLGDIPVAAYYRR